MEMWDMCSMETQYNHGNHQKMNLQDSLLLYLLTFWCFLCIYIYLSEYKLKNQVLCKNWKLQWLDWNSYNKMTCEICQLDVLILAFE